MLKETGIEDVLRGDRLCRAVSEQTGLPVRYACFLEPLADAIQKLDILGERFPLKLKMRENWMS